MKALAKNYSRYPVEFMSGKGCSLFDIEGNEYLDLLSGIAVTGFGHSYKAINEAVQYQMNSLWHVSNLFESSGQELLSRKLVNRTGLDSVFLCNSGTEANEAAIKYARLWGSGRTDIITAIGGFHGRTMGSLSASAQYKLWDGFHPLTPGFKHVPYDDISSIVNSIDEHTCAIMVEPIQGESGIVVPSEDYLSEIRSICDQNNLLMIADEVQTGMGRTGKLFAYQWNNVLPDIVTTAKGIANGIPLGAAIFSKKVADVITPGTHGSTFGGNPLAVAAANKVLDLLDEQMLEQIIESGKLLKDELEALESNGIESISGKGLMLGIKFSDQIDSKDVIKKLLFEERIVAGGAENNVLRLLPPFIITENDIKKFISKFRNLLSSVQSLSKTISETA